MKPSLVRVVSLSSLLLGCAGSFLACGGDDDVTDDTPGDDDVSSSGGAHADGGSSSSSSSSSSGKPSSSGGSSSSSSSSGTAPTFAVGGTLTGLTGSSVVLNDNGGDALTLTADGPFTFATKLADGASYEVSIATQPTGNRCTVQNPQGTIAGADVTDVGVTCVPSYRIGGTVTGLHGTLGLATTGGDAITVSADGPFTLPTSLIAGETYEVSIAAQPSGQLCTITDGTGTGTVVATDVTTVEITCRNLALAINEIYARVATTFWGDTNADGVRDPSADEFVEIMNDEPFAVSLEGLKLLSGKNPLVRFTFPAGTTLAAGGRAVVFGGGTPTGDFGGAQTFVADLNLDDAPATATTLQLAGEIVVLDEFAWTDTPFGSSCTTDCASITRSPETHGSPLVAHTAAAPNVLQSPGTAFVAAVPKLLRGFSLPPGSPISTTAFFRAQYNEKMNSAQLGASATLYNSTCAAPANPVATVPTLENLDSAVRLTPQATLGFGQPYCLVTGNVSSIQSVALDTTMATAIDFTTRAAVSAPADGVVISQVGGTAFSGSHNEFVELYNASAAEVDVSGWFIQRRAAGGGTSCFATLPANTKIPAHRFFLVGGSGYANAVAADFAGTGTALTGTNESVLLLRGGSCGTAVPELANRVDAVSYGSLTDGYAGLYLPAIPAAGTIIAVRRKACYDSTADANVDTGILAGGGQATDGSSEHIGASNADFLQLAAIAPRNAAVAEQTRTCD